MGPTSRNEGCGFRSEAAREHPSARVAFDREVEIGKAQRIWVEEDRRIVASNCFAVTYQFSERSGAPKYPT
jgi:hypothetical protein